MDYVHRRVKEVGVHYYESSYYFRSGVFVEGLDEVERLNNTWAVGETGSHDPCKVELTVRVRYGPYRLRNSIG